MGEKSFLTFMDFPWLSGFPGFGVPVLDFNLAETILEAPLR